MKYLSFIKLLFCSVLRVDSRTGRSCPGESLALTQNPSLVFFFKIQHDILSFSPHLFNVSPSGAQMKHAALQ